MLVDPNLSSFNLSLGMSLTVIILLCLGAFGMGLGFAFFLLERKKQSAENEGLTRFSTLIEREFSVIHAEMIGQRSAVAETERALGARVEGLHTVIAERLGTLSNVIGREQAEARAAQAEAMQALIEASTRQLAEIRQSVTEQLHHSVEQQMQTSFQRVLEQFSAMQKAMGEVHAMTAQIGDLKKLFSNIKTRGGWGEAQLRAILEDILPPEAYESNVRLGKGNEVVEFALRMPVRGAIRPLLPLDSKFPTESYERLLNAIEESDSVAEKAARKSLENTVRLEARKIATKYIQPPQTVEFAVLYLPTDGLYTEVARIPGLIDEIGRQFRIILMGPALMPALIRTIHLGYVTLALEEKTEAIASLLLVTKQEMIRMDTVLDKLARNAQTMSTSIEEARKRTRVVSRKLKDLSDASQEEQEVLSTSHGIITETAYDIEGE